ncbi:MAG: hypothetical protein CL681_01990 [Blastopirellula sp.]|nr:hypothetical protein [Blastopirellula sp.]MAR08730.1 hypothetical protein [Blastopirellula sp.]|tara:strand:+ start:4322 stop:4543 length:222 start_codon:yes stop_codon:yes gene_type:complete
MPLAHPLLSPPWAVPVGVVTAVLVIVLVTWALQLLQVASEQQEFSLTLAGCMVCSAAVGLLTVMVMALNGIPL